ncbi:MAG: hypothetical protein K6B68_08915 [Eubacterium sp.]|nr:hypothetical protein [Eubacterium sp.]
MGILTIFLILFPMALAVVLRVLRQINPLSSSKNTVAKWISFAGAALMLLGTAMISIRWLMLGAKSINLLFSMENIDYFVFAVECMLMIWLASMSFRRGRYITAIFAFLSFATLAFLQLYGYVLECGSFIYINWANVFVMICMAAGFGYLIIYSAKKSEKFIPALFLLMGAMYGVALTTSILWMHLFWTLSGIAAFWVIDGKAEHDESCSFRILCINLFGATVIAVGISIFSYQSGYSNLNMIMDYVVNWDVKYAIAATILFLIAGLTLAGQIPVFTWINSGNASEDEIKSLIKVQRIFVPLNAGVILIVRIISEYLIMRSQL